LRRLLQSHPGDIFGDADQVENRRDDLHHDVEENVSKLNLLTKKEANRRADNKWEGSFKGTIFTKGRMLLSGIVDKSILPQLSACR